MRQRDAQLGTPQALYKGTKAAIEALTGIPEGAVAYATDTNEFGSYDGSVWTWGQGGAHDHDADYQPVDSDLTAIAGLSPSDGDLIMRVGGVWVNVDQSTLLSQMNEMLEDLIGAVVAGGSNSGITVTYDDTDGVIIFELIGSEINSMIADYLDVTVYPGWHPITGITFTRTAADDPTYTVQATSADLRTYLSEGCPIKWTQNSIVRYGFVSSDPVYSGGNTTFTVLTRCNDASANYDVLDTGTHAISDFYFAPPKQPGVGFPVDPDKWTVTVTDTSDRTQSSPTTNTWYNLGSISITIPIGTWRVGYKASGRVSRTASTSTNQFTTLSTANNSESNSQYTSITTIGGASGTLLSTAIMQLNNAIFVLAAKTTYYLNARTTLGATDIAHRGDSLATLIKAECAYL